MPNIENVSMPRLFLRIASKSAGCFALSLTAFLAGCGGGERGFANDASGSQLPSANTALPQPTAGDLPQQDSAQNTVQGTSSGAAAQPEPSTTALIEPDVAIIASPGGTLELSIDGPEVGVSYDTVIVEGAAVVGGSLILKFGPSYMPAPGERFLVLSAVGGITGQFAAILSNRALKVTPTRDETHLYVTTMP